jgi:hypothetical protein
MKRSSAARKINYQADVPELTDFGVSPDGLPVFNGTTFEAHVNGWNDIEGPKSQLQWAQAAIAASLVSKHGERTIETFAYEVKKSGRYVRGLADTYRAFKNGGRMAYLSFWHHYVAAQSTDPLNVIRIANDREMSTRELERHVKLQAKKPSSRVAKRRLALVASEPNQEDQPQTIETEEFVDEETNTAEDSEVLVADIVTMQRALSDLKTRLQSPYLITEYLNKYVEELDWELEQATAGSGKKSTRLLALIQSGCFTKPAMCERGRFTMAEVNSMIAILLKEKKIVEDKQYKGEMASGITNTVYRPRDLSYADSYQPKIER